MNVERIVAIIVDPLWYDEGGIEEILSEIVEQLPSAGVICEIHNSFIFVLPLISLFIKTSKSEIYTQLLFFQLFIFYLKFNFKKVE